MQKLSGFLKLIRAANLLIIALSLSLFYYLIIVPVHLNILLTTLTPFSPAEFIGFVLSVILLAAAGNVINDYFDFELDKEFKPKRPLPSGLMSLDDAMYLHMGLLLSGIGLGFYMGWRNGNTHLGYLYLICALLLYIYSSYLKKIPLVGNIVIAALSAFVFVLLMIFEADYLRQIHAGHLFENTGYAFTVLMLQMKFYAGFAFLTSLAREFVKDIEDREGDKAYNIDTFAVQYGETPAKWLTVLVLLVLLVALGIFMQGFFTAGAIKELAYLGFAVVVPVLVAIGFLIRAKVQKDYGRISVMLKLIMVFGILSIPAFHWLRQTT